MPMTSKISRLKPLKSMVLRTSISKNSRMTLMKKSKISMIKMIKKSTITTKMTKKTKMMMNLFCKISKI